MDKLKPVLEQKFWIFFGVVFIMPLVGYFMTKGPMAAQIDTRWNALNSTFGSIPQGTGVPNDLWTKNAKDINAQCELNNKKAHKALWDAQAKLMRWPSRIAPQMKTVEYFKAIPLDKQGDKVQRRYADEYVEELRTLWQIVDPLDDGKNLRDASAKRKVAFPMANLQQANTAGWDQGATFDQIWAAQEDIWLQTELLSAIKRINEHCNSQHDAFIRQLGKIVLFGGERAAGDTGAAATQSSGSGSPMGMEGNAFGSMGGGFGGSGSRTDGKSAGLVEIALSEEFNASIESTGSSNSQFGYGQSTEPSNPGSGPTGGPAGATGTSTVKRYIDSTDDKSAYKRRGFSITLVMDHRKVPDLLAELMNSPFSVEIVRVHQGIYVDGSGPSNSGQSNPMGGFAGGSGGPVFGAPVIPVNDGGSNGALALPNDDSAGGNFFGGGAQPNQPRSGAQGTVSAMADPNLASVAIVGVWTLYRPPAEDPNQPPPNNPGTPTDPGLATTSGSTTVTNPPATDSADNKSEPMKTEPTESSEDKPEDPAKADDKPAAKTPIPDNPTTDDSESSPSSEPPKKKEATQPSNDE